MESSTMTTRFPSTTPRTADSFDTSTHEELIASSHSVEEIRQIIGADTLSFLSVDGLLKGVGRTFEDTNCGQCLACFTGKYPTEIYQDTVLPHVKEAVLTK
jgi:amidophosphoribosyltransferase